tara:strand:+ start:1195 stop:2742 length:1548 start_codon:yes stop_codon:yes gene_type:complete
MQSRDFESVTSLLADTVLAYAGTGTDKAVAGKTVVTRSEGFSYTVAASGATDQHVTTAGGVKLYVIPGMVGFSITAFGAVGGDVTKDRPALLAALAAAAEVSSFCKTVFLPDNTYHAYDIEVPGGVSLVGQSRAAAGIFVPDGTNPSYIIKPARTSVTIKNLTLDGNWDNNTTGTGIDCSAATVDDPVHFLTIKDLFIKKCPEVGIDLIYGNMTEITNISITRCDIGYRQSRCVHVGFYNVDIAKFLTAGVVMQASPVRNQLHWFGGFMEETLVETAAPVIGVSFFKLINMRNFDSLLVEGVSLYGHSYNGDTNLATSTGFAGNALGNLDIVGVHIVDPLFVDNIKFVNVEMRDIQTPSKYTGLVPDEIGNVDLTGVYRHDNTGNFLSQYGVLTEDSYSVNFISDALDLAFGSTRVLYPVEARNCRVEKAALLITESISGSAGAARFGNNSSVGAFGANMTIASPLAVGEVVDLTQDVGWGGAYNGTTARFIRFDMQTPVGTAGKAKLAINATVF